MFEINDYVVYKKDVCKIIDTKVNSINNVKYYVLIPLDDNTLKIDVPVDNKFGYLRNLISKDQVDEIIKEIPNIDIISDNNHMIEAEYRSLLATNKHENLIKIIKTTYLRNKERLDNNKKARDKDIEYFHQAEKYLYNEFSIVLGLSYDETREYVISNVLKQIQNQ